MALYLGLDSSTQSLTAMVLEIEGDHHSVVFESALMFDEVLPQYGTRHGVLPRNDPAVAVSSPLMWADALDTMLGRVASSGLDLSALAAISGSAQQHGSVYMNASARLALVRLDPGRPPGEQLAGALSRPIAPIWMDSSTSEECAELTAAVGGPAVLAERTGSRAFERFTGPQIRRFFKRDSQAYAATDRIHLVSSFMASLLIGRHAPIDPGDASGTNLMDLATSQWWPTSLDGTAPALAHKLPPIVPSSTVIGRLSPYWRMRHGLPSVDIVAWSGDNPCSLIGTGLVREGLVAVSLGTSDTLFGLMRRPNVDRSGTGHVFGAPTGDYMGLTCFRNGSLAREHVRDAFGLTWAGFSRVLLDTPAGNYGRILLPWYEPEITPPVFTGGVRRYGVPSDDGPGQVRAVVEAQQMALALHSQWMNVDIDRIHATGGAAANREILQVMADVFGAAVYRFEAGNSACLGAALRAVHARAKSKGRPLAWDEVVREIAEPLAGGAVQPNHSHQLIYRELMRTYAACEAHALGRGPDPGPLLADFGARFGGGVERG